MSTPFLSFPRGLVCLAREAALAVPSGAKELRLRRDPSLRSGRPKRLSRNPVPASLSRSCPGSFDCARQTLRRECPSGLLVSSAARFAQDDGSQSDSDPKGTGVGSE
jgi:hypothetical protein